MAKYEIVLNWRVFVSIVSREIEEKVEKYSIVLPLLPGHCKSVQLSYFRTMY